MKLANWIKQRSGLQIVAITTVTVLTLGAILGLAQYFNKTDQTRSSNGIATNSQTSNHDSEYQATATPNAATLAATTDPTKASLLYLIEEEKLAHDVYLTMYQLYGAKTFNNILNSETQHQNLVAGVLSARAIADPRSAKVGVFVNSDLQKLYNDLVAQGSKNLTEAYKVGVAIEELDIADLKKDMAELDPAQTDVVAILQTLLRGSENHLRAFNRKLG